jgi:hypothetical protein
MEDGRARLRGRQVPVIDSFEFAGSNVIPATVDLDISWNKKAPFQQLGAGDTVPGNDPSAFSGRFAPARAVGRVSGNALGFHFSANGNSDRGYAEIGTERNGSFL